MRCVRMKGDIKVLLGCFLGIVLLALLVVTCKETDGSKGVLPTVTRNLLCA